MARERVDHNPVSARSGRRWRAVWGGLPTAVLLCVMLSTSVVPAVAKTPGSYPRLANIYFPSLSGAVLEDLARYDVLVLPARGEELTRDELAELRCLNPDIILLAHMPIGYHGDWGSPSIFSDVMDAANANDWWLRDRIGQRVRLGCGDYVLNLTTWCPPDEDGRIYSDWMAKHIADRLAPGGLWDGVYLDYCMDDIAWVGDGLAWGVDADGNAQEDPRDELNEAWRAGTARLVSRLREYVGPDYLLVTNGNNTLYDVCDGGTREDFPNMHGDWYDNIMAPEYGYAAIQTRYRDPSVNIINTIWYGVADPNADMPSPAAEQKLRYTLASTLVYGDAYYSFDGGRGLPHHCQTWWHELFELDLGQPVDRGLMVEAWPGESPWIENGDMVAQRQFTRGMVVVNPSTCSQRLELGGVYYPSTSWNGSFYPYHAATTNDELGFCSGAFYAGSGRVISAVMDIVFKEGADGNVLLSWDEVEGAVAYAVYRSDARSPGGSSELVAIVDGPQYCDERTDLRSAVTYSVSPIDEMLCEGRPSSPISVSPDAWYDMAEASMSDLPDGRGMLPEGHEAVAYDGRGGSPEGRHHEGSASVLHGPLPNPAVTESTIAFTLGDDERWGGGRPTSVTLFDIRGRIVRTLLDDRLPAGRHETRWDLRDERGERVAAGCYLVALSSGEETLRGKLLVVN